MARPTPRENPKASLFGPPGTDLSKDEPLAPAPLDHTQKQFPLLKDIPPPPRIQPLVPLDPMVDLEILPPGLWQRFQWKLEPLGRRVRLKFMLMRIKFPRAAAWAHRSRRPLALSGVLAIALGAMPFLRPPPSIVVPRVTLVSVAPPASGTVTWVASSHERIKEGELLVVIDPAETTSTQLAPFKKAVQIAEAAVRKAKAAPGYRKASGELTQRKRDLDSAAKTQAMTANRVKQKKATRAQLAAANKRLLAAQVAVTKATAVHASVSAPVATAEEKLRSALGELEAARARADRLEVRSPVSGRIATRAPASLIGTKVRGGEAILAVASD